MVNQINNLSERDFSADCWFNEIRDLFDGFASVSFTYCNRGSNGTADRIAKNARSCKINADWFFSYPSWIVNHLSLDNCPCNALVAI